jgi:MFS family permease
MATMGAGYGVLFTMLDDYRDEYGIGESLLGTIIGAGFFAGFLSQILIAPLADRGHARTLVLGGVALNTVGLVAMALSTAFVPLLIGRVVMGIGIGTAFPAIRRIVILAEPDRLGHNVGRLLSADVAGFAVGPIVSAVLVGPFGIPAPFLAIAAGTAFVLPFVARVHVVETPEPPQQRLAFDLLRVRPFAGAVALGAALFLMVGAFDSLWVVVFDDLEASDLLANLGITIFAVPLVLFASAGGRLAQRVGPFRLGTLGLLVGAACMFTYGLLPTAGAMFAVAMVHSLNDGFTVSSSGVAAAMTVPAERQAGAQGMLGGVETATAGVTAIATGAMYEHFGRGVAFGVSATAMLALVVAGAWLAAPAWSLRGSSSATSPAVATDGQMQPVAPT